MKTYTVKHKTAYTKKVFVVAAENETVAVSICMAAEVEWDIHGNTFFPNACEFEAELIEGVTSRKEGIKSKLYV